MNLVNNAVEACASGATIHIVGRVNECSAIELRVEDKGHGIEPAVAERMFEPYFSRRQRGPMGSGQETRGRRQHSARAGLSPLGDSLSFASAP